MLKLKIIYFKLVILIWEKLTSYFSCSMFIALILLKIKIFVALVLWFALLWEIQALLDVSRPGLQPSTSRALSWIQCKLGKQYLVKKFTLPWESNPGPTPIRGGLATILVYIWVKKLNIKSAWWNAVICFCWHILPKCHNLRILSHFDEI